MLLKGQRIRSNEFFWGFFYYDDSDDGGDDVVGENEAEFEEQEIVPHKDKVNLSQKVKLLSQEQLGQIVKIIQDECPEAFKEVIGFFKNMILF